MFRASGNRGSGMKFMELYERLMSTVGGEIMESGKQRAEAKYRASYSILFEQISLGLLELSSFCRNNLRKTTNKGDG